ncbi:MAG: hypothetical protein WBD74_02960 [Candidatus Aquilonibacter sp.]
MELRLEALFIDLRSIERAARVRLLAGCAEDEARIEEFFERPLCKAKTDATLALARQDGFDRIALTFARAVWANVNLRLRARFKIYTSELADAEIAIALAIAATRTARAKRHLPRMFALQRVRIDEAPAPDAPRHASEIATWVEELHGLVRDEVRRSVTISLGRVLAQGTNRLGVVKTRIDLALPRLAQLPKTRR